MATEVEELKKLKTAQIDGSQKSQVADEDGDVVSIKTNANTNSNELLVNLEGHICEENTTMTPLLANATFEGGWQDTLDYGMISMSVKADKDSATDGLVIQWSPDKSIIADTDVFTISSNVGKVFTFGPASRYVRVLYTNGGDDQSVFNLQTLLRRVYVKPSSHRIQDSIIGEDDAELVKAVLTGLSPAGSFKNVQVTNNGNQKISIEEFESDVSVNENTQLKVSLYDDTGNIVNDGITSAVKILTYPHSEVHSGNSYHHRKYHALAKAATLDHLIVTKNSEKLAHITIGVDNKAGHIFTTIYEDTEVSANGVAQEVRNRNRNRLDSNDDDGNETLVFLGPTVTNVGSFLSSYSLGAGKNKAGGEHRDAEEIVLKANTIYLLRSIEQDVEATVVTVYIDWYEHTNK